MAFGLDDLMHVPHPLLGRMSERHPDQVRRALLEYAPSQRQLDEIVAEELTGLDRPAVHRILRTIAVAG